LRSDEGPSNTAESVNVPTFGRKRLSRQMRDHPIGHKSRRIRTKRYLGNTTDDVAALL
jgi:hypothetical protein